MCVGGGGGEREREERACKFVKPGKTGISEARSWPALPNVLVAANFLDLAVQWEREHCPQRIVSHFRRQVANVQDFVRRENV